MSNKICWSHPALGIVVELYYERGTRDEPPYTEIEAIYADCVTPPQDISRLFNHDALMDDFWKYRPDLGDY